MLRRLGAASSSEAAEAQATAQATQAGEVLVARRVGGDEVVLLVADQVGKDAAAADGAAVGVAQVEPRRVAATALVGNCNNTRRIKVGSPYEDVGVSWQPCFI